MTATTMTSQVTCPTRLLNRGDHVVIDGRLVEITGNHPQTRLGDERREFARTYEVAWMDVESWQLDGRVFAADQEFPFVQSNVEGLDS